MVFGKIQIIFINYRLLIIINSHIILFCICKSNSRHKCNISITIHGILQYYRNNEQY